MELEDLVKKNGFESEREFHKLVSSVNLSSPQKMAAFKKWKEEDGTKEGILKLDLTLDIETGFKLEEFKKYLRDVVEE